MTTKVLNGLDLSGQRIQSVGSPSGANDAANKGYVDAVARGVQWKDAVRASPTGNVDIATGLVAGTVVDGVTLAAGDRVLLRLQTAGAENGIYVSPTSGAAARATDADASAEVRAGMAVTVTEGATNGDTTWILTTDDPITLGTTALSFTALGGGSSYSAGNGLTLSGSTFHVGAGTGISVGADTVSIDTALVARRYATTIGDGSATVIAVTHNLGTRDVVTVLYDAATPYAEALTDVEHTDTNTVTLRFPTAPASGAYRVVVTG